MIRDNSHQHNVRARRSSGSVLRRQNGQLEIKDNIIAFRELVIPLELCFVSPTEMSISEPLEDDRRFKCPS